jgi:hypothetical protein
MIETGLRPYDDPYPGQIHRIRELLAIGVTVHVEHTEFMTRKSLVIAPMSGMSFFGRPDGMTGGGWLLTWVYHGSMWVPNMPDMHFGYVAEKLRIDKWPSDAKSIAAFISSLQTGSVARAEGL